MGNKLNQFSNDMILALRPRPVEPQDQSQGHCVQGQWPRTRDKATNFGFKAMAKRKD